MTKKILLCLFFFTLSPLVLFLPIYYLSFFDQGKILGEAISLPPTAGKILSAQSSDENVMAATILGKDSTAIIVETYLERYQSPLLPFAAEILNAGEKYKVSPQLILAIAQQESNLGKKSPEDCHNAWGWGIHSQGTMCFASWPEAIEAVTKGIAEDYCAKGYCDDPCLMMKKYTPRSNGSWCAGIKQFLTEMETGDF